MLLFFVATNPHFFFKFGFVGEGDGMQKLFCKKVSALQKTLKRGYFIKVFVHLSQKVAQS